jgi:hypothetical protein
MATQVICSFPDDIGSGGGYAFQAQVDNSTNSIYSNLYLNISTTSPSIAELTADVGPAFWLSGTLQQACNRESALCVVVDETEYCMNINPNSKGLAAVESAAFDGSNPISTSAFYVESLSDPLSLWIPNAGSYYGMSCTIFPALRALLIAGKACTDGFGDGQYFLI